MSSETLTQEPPTARSRRRDEIPDRFKWNLNDIFDELGGMGSGLQGSSRPASTATPRSKGRCAADPDRLLDAFRLSEELGQLAYRVWYYPSLQYDEDQRDNTVNAQAPAGADPVRALEAGRVVVQPRAAADPAGDRARMDGRTPALRVYRFAIEDLYRQQEHVLDESGERLMSLASRLASAPNDAYWALSTADAKFPTVTLVERRDGHGLVRSVPRHPGDAARAGRPRKGVHRAARHLPRLAQHLRALYNAVCQRDWF